MTNQHLIFGVHIQNRGENAAAVQKLLTQYGCNIKTRLGLHEVSENFCATGGIVLLEMAGDPALCNELFDQLNALPGIEAQKMVFNHD